MEVLPNYSQPTLCYCETIKLLESSLEVDSKVYELTIAAVHALLVGAMTPNLLATGFVNEDPPLGLGGGKEMRPVFGTSAVGSRV